MITHVKIKGGRLGGTSRGQDVRIYVVDENGMEHTLPIKKFRIVCDNRKNHVELFVSMVIDEIDLEGVPCFVDEVIAPDNSSEKLTEAKGLSFEAAVSKISTRVKSPIRKCSSCGGSGDADYYRADNASGPGTPGPRCHVCKGTGRVAK